MPDRPFLSIGEVLALLKDEFPDITISKIRFLESQGLLDPDRTPSGYRKFYEPDVERLRWILRQQREHFLPLKVIKGRLAVDGGTDERGAGAVASPPLPEPPGTSVLSPVGLTGANLTLEELSRASGLSTEDLTELGRYGLLEGATEDGGGVYDEGDLLIANLAAGFMKFGVEPRHLRMYRLAADREGAFLEQVVMPMLKQRNPEGRRQALRTLEELARLGQGFRDAMLRRALSNYAES